MAFWLSAQIAKAKSLTRLEKDLKPKLDRLEGKIELARFESLGNAWQSKLDQIREAEKAA